MILLLGLNACGSSSAEEAAAAGASATAHYQAGDYRNARDAAWRAAASRDDVAEYWLLLGRSELELRNYVDALEAFRRAHELDRSNLEALRALAELSVLLKRFDEAENFVKQALSLDPGDARVRIANGHIALKRGDRQAALAIAEEVIRKDPRYLGALVLKSNVLAASGRGGEAGDIMENALRVHGQSAPLLEALLEIYQKTNDSLGERRTYARLVALSPDDAKLQLGLAGSLYRAGMASAGFDRILRLHRSRPDDPRLPGEIADLWLHLGGTPAGLREIRMLSGEGGSAMKVAMARYALDSGWPDETVRILEPLVSGGVSHGTAGVAALYAQAALATGRTKEAQLAAERVLALDSTQPRALWVRTTIALNQNRLNDALAGAMLLASEYPRSSEYRVLLARVHSKRGEQNLALQTLKQASKEFPTNSAVFSAHVEFLERAGQLDRALALADAFTDRNRQSREGRARRTELCRKAGQKACLQHSYGRVAAMASGTRI